MKYKSQSIHELGYLLTLLLLLWTYLITGKCLGSENALLLYHNRLLYFHIVCPTTTLKRLYLLSKAFGGLNEGLDRSKLIFSSEEIVLRVQIET